MNNLLLILGLVLILGGAAYIHLGFIPVLVGLSFLRAYAVRS